MIGSLSIFALELFIIVGLLSVYGIIMEIENIGKIK